MKKLLTGFWFGTTAEAFEGELPLYEISTVCPCCSERIRDNVRQDEELTCSGFFNLLVTPPEFGELVPPTETAKEAFKRIQTDFLKFDIEQAQGSNFNFIDNEVDINALAERNFKSIYNY